MQHLDVMMHPGYDAEGFRPKFGQRGLRLFGGGGGKRPPPPPPPPEPPPQPPQLPQAPQPPLTARSMPRSAPNVLRYGPAQYSTFLTGSSGVDDDTFLLGRNRLLGQ